MTVGGKGTDALHGSTSGKDNEGVNDNKVNEYGSAIAILELENKRKDEMIALLEEEVAGLKRKLEAQAVNIVRGFECVLGIKNKEVDKLKKENIKLRRSVLVLEDQLADRDVHVVTQAFRDVEVRGDSVGGSIAGVRAGGQVVYDVSSIRAGMGGANMCSEAVGPNAGCVVIDSDGEQCGRNVDGIVNVDLSDAEKGSDRVVDVDAVVVKGNKWSGFDINNRLGVWKMMTVEEKCRIKQGYDRHGDQAVMWEDGEAGVVVDFSDVKNLIRQSSIYGNVIDAYVELLKSEHLRMYGDDELADKSYFFSSVCLDIVKKDDVRAMEKFDRTNVSAASDCQFIHFPMCHDGHWTQRGDRADVHHNVATLLKECVTNVMKQTLREFGLDEQSILANFSSSLEAYMHRCDVERSLQGTNCIILRANMVKAFVNDPARGLKD
ncbi:hypothetical protein CsSME_00046437 [Camellia sinensis var. sinensis]